MSISLHAEDGSCTLKEETNPSSNEFTIGIKKRGLQSAIRELLVHPEKRDITVDGIMIHRYRDGLQVNTQHGRFDLPYRLIFAIALVA